MATTVRAEIYQGEFVEEYRGVEVSFPSSFTPIRLHLRAGDELHTDRAAESALLLFCCVRTVSEPHLFQPWNLRFERKQIPRFVVNVNS